MDIVLERGSRMENQYFITGNIWQKTTAYFFTSIFVNKTTIYLNIQNPMNYEKRGIC